MMHLLASDELVSVVVKVEVAFPLVALQQSLLQVWALPLEVEVSARSKQVDVLVLRFLHFAVVH